ncbi:MAG TPA: hypothetical protein VKX30_00185, partial [Flavobacteriaceae bacterium]|nr:hypothetical protein [Flavobacteriaceae bacterium]
EDLAFSTENIIGTLDNEAVSENAKSFLRDAISNSMDYIYWGIVFFAILIFIFMYLVPHRDPNDEHLIKIERE